MTTPHKLDDSVWMTSKDSQVSVAREIAMLAILAMDLDPNDFRLRDKVIVAISNVVAHSLDAVANDSIYKRAMESMAAQFVHPKTTAYELAKLQLGIKEPVA